MPKGILPFCTVLLPRVKRAMGSATNIYVRESHSIAVPKRRLIARCVGFYCSLLALWRVVFYRQTHNGTPLRLSLILAPTGATGI